MKKYQVIVEIELDDFVEVSTIMCDVLRGCEVVLITEYHYSFRHERKLDFMELIQLMTPILTDNAALIKKVLITENESSLEGSADLLFRIPLYGLFLPAEIEVHPSYDDVTLFKNFTIVKLITACDYYSPDLLNQKLMNSSFYSYHFERDDEKSKDTVHFYDVTYSD